MLNRRRFFSRLGAAAAGTAAASTLLQGTVADLPDVVVADGIEARWLGWQTPSQQPDLIWGVWLFTLPDTRQAYSTTLGVFSSNHQLGNAFDTSWPRGRAAPWGDLLSVAASEDDRRAQRQRAYDDGLRQTIAWRDAPPAPEPAYTSSYAFGFTGFTPPRKG